MKPGTTPPSPDEDVASAAENLLGIDLSSSQLPAGPIDLDDSDLFGEPDAEEPDEAPQSAVEAADVEDSPTAGADPADDDGDFGAGLDVASEPPPPAVRQPRPKPAPSAIAKPVPRAAKSASLPAAEEPLVKPAAEESPQKPDAQSAGKDDSYWDALEGWDWDDEPGAEKADSSKSESSGPRRRGQGRSRGRSSERAGRSGERPGRRREESRPRRKPVDDDFGSGIDEESTDVKDDAELDADVSVFGLDPTESQERSLDRKPQGRRRRPAARRPKHADETRDTVRDEAEPDPDVSVFDLNPTESQERSIRGDSTRRRARPAARADEDVDDGDDFGAGLEDATGDESRRRKTPERADDSEESGPRRGRRRRGRGRGRDSERSEAAEERRPSRGRRERTPPVDDDDDSQQRDDADSQDLESREPRFQDVPTWAEAIGLLVKSTGRSEESSDGGRRRASSSESRGERGGRGRGRGGRRGSGRRRSE